jgi:hypothetical protein
MLWQISAWARPCPTVRPPVPVTSYDVKEDKALTIPARPRPRRGRQL